LLTGLLASALLTVPGQAKWELGAEFVVLALGTTIVAIVLDRRAGESRNAFGRLLDLANPTSITAVLLLVVGVVLVLGHRRGLYVVVPALFAVVIGGVINAWLILVRLSE
jgi:hypothetical protein